jgi:hypothetical protein
MAQTSTWRSANTYRETVALATSSKDGRGAVLRALLISALVLVPRGLLISNAQSERYDDEYHLNRGVAFLRHAIGDRALNDPPLGEALTAMPLVVTGSYSPDPAVDMGIYGHQRSPEALLNLIAIWKTILFLPMIAVAFLWVRELYGPRAGWVAVALLLIEPTFAAHIPLPTIDVLGVEGIVFACYAAWKYFQRPTFARLFLMCLAVAFALVIKHTAVILPGAIGALAVVWWVVIPWRLSRGGGFVPGPDDSPENVPSVWRRRAFQVLLACVLVPLCMWALMGFEVSQPLKSASAGKYPDTQVIRLLLHNWPMGAYIRAFATGFLHAESGHSSFLLGVSSLQGWWYYFPVVAAYKLPVGILALLLIGVASVFKLKPRIAELSLLIPAVAWTVFMMSSNINIGFRHFLPALTFILLLSARAAVASKRWMWTTVVALVVAGVHTLTYHPNYLSYLNAPYENPYLAISDSNLDWGQGLKQVRDWSLRQAKDRPIALAFFGTENDTSLHHYLDGTPVQVVLRTPYDKAELQRPLPTTGLFVVSPFVLSGTYDVQHRQGARASPLTITNYQLVGRRLSSTDGLRQLWAEAPVELIGQSLLVYDLDQIRAGQPSSGTRR